MRRSKVEQPRLRQAMSYTTSEMQAIKDYVMRDLNDELLVQSIHFSPTSLTVLRRILMSSGTIVTDTSLVMAGIEEKYLAQLGLNVECYIDEPQVIEIAEIRKLTRAEIALDYALSSPGPKLIVIGSAPMALKKLLLHKKSDGMRDVVVLAAPTGFASVIQLKERLWESEELSSIVVRGRNGGIKATASILNALLSEACKKAANQSSGTV